MNVKNNLPLGEQHQSRLMHGEFLAAGGKSADQSLRSISLTVAVSETLPA
jgi:hypothetical protein